MVFLFPPIASLILQPECIFLLALSVLLTVFLGDVILLSFPWTKLLISLALDEKLSVWNLSSSPFEL